ncbi:MAG: hypothetical protein V7L29_00560 [Nostoc sp.]|uniref:hypothetical protein n=1 Tax=Nostoc sp. TaxID=1180 RepID=UPI002FF4FDA1
MSSIYVTSLSYVNKSGAGGRMNVRANSSTGLTINKSQEVFLAGGRSNKTTVAVTDSSIEADGNDLLLGGKGNHTLVGDLNTDTLTRDADDNLFEFNAETSDSLLSDVISDSNNSNLSEGDSISIGANKNLSNDLGFAGFDLLGDGEINNTLVQLKNSFLSGANSFYF